MMELTGIRMRGKLGGGNILFKLNPLMKYIVLIVCSFLLFSCQNRRKKDVVTLLKKWSNKEILFPDNSIFTKQGADTVEFPMQSKYKILIYVDSIGCISCKLQLDKWKELIKATDKMYNVQYLFFFSSEKKRDILNTLKSAGFTYPICIDEKNRLNQLNHFPLNMEFQTFLLDENNKVLAIGNPIHNPKIKELYLNIIQGKKDVEGEKTLRTEINIEEPLISLGRFNWKEERKATFKIENIGKHPLVINDVTTSCGCTSVDYSKEPVRPGDSISLQVTYKADHPEHFDKTITVYCNANPSLVHLKIMGDAE